MIRTLVPVVVALASFGAGVAVAQTSDPACATFMTDCAGEMDAACLSALGAGSVAAAASVSADCAGKLDAYKECLAAFAQMCGGVVDPAAETITTPFGTLSVAHETAFWQIVSWWGAASGVHQGIELTIYNQTAGAIDDIRLVFWQQTPSGPTTILDRTVAFLERDAQRTVKGEGRDPIGAAPLVSCIAYRIGEARHVRIDAWDTADVIDPATATQLPKARRSEQREGGAEACDVFPG